MGHVVMNLLGPWEIRAGDGTVHVPSGRLRTLLTSLALSPGEPVGLDVLAGRVWPERLPRRAHATLHTDVGRLRELLGPDVIRAHPSGGYLLSVEREAVDLQRFRVLLRQAEQACPAQELTLLREALGLWRGRPFADLYSTWLDRDVLPRLTEEWFAATERRVDLELAAGHSERVIAELRELTRCFPAREGLWARLITTLHGGGRRTEALGAFLQARASLTELEVEPSDHLVALQQAILLDDTPPDTQRTAGPPRPPTPRQLPHDIATLTGREEELAHLDTLLTYLGGVAPTIVSIDGPPGVGKTALAVHWAHRVRPHCQEVQLHLDLRGYGPGKPVAPAAAAAALLRALGTPPNRIPVEADERFAALRTALADRRPLLLLDNARDVEQVRPLLPGTAAMVIVTSRNQLHGLSVRDGAHRLTVRRLSNPQAVHLLAKAIGEDRATCEPTAVTRLAALCDHLPLALAIVAERAQRTTTLAELVTALENARLDNLNTGENDPHTDMRTALSWSYRALNTEAAAMFRNLGLHATGAIDVHLAAATAGVPVPTARLALDQLTSVHLLEQQDPHHYKLPDLVGAYARETALAITQDPSTGAHQRRPRELRRP
jgi:DNA-binding SARP family transcriptional activator